MQILLLDLEPTLCEAWRREFAALEDLRVHNGPFEPLIGTYDCLVSPANSFDLMDGGIDAAIIRFFGVSLERRVQDEIWRVYRGEQPVGTCLMVPTGHPHCPWIAHCPTMRVPADVSRTSNACAEFLAALTTAQAVGVQVLACPGLGTLTGRIPPHVAARQMRYAYHIWSAPCVRSSWNSLEERGWRASGRSRREYAKQQLGLSSEG